MARYRMPDITPVNAVPASEPLPAVEKHPHVPAARVPSDWPDAAREMARRYNSMRAKLMESGLMHDKE